MDKKEIFQLGKKPIIGMVHLKSLPGSSSYDGLEFSNILKRALKEARILYDGGVDGILIQNTNDRPFSRPFVNIETIPFYTIIAREIQNVVKCPIGVNVQLLGSIPALSIAKAINAQFVRIKVFYESVLTLIGRLDGEAPQAMSFKKRIKADNVQIIADVYHRGSQPLADFPISIAAQASWNFGKPDALVIAGNSVEDSINRMIEIRKKLPEAILLAGGGTNSQNIGKFLELCDGAIIGAGIKDNNSYSGNIDPYLLKDYINAVIKFKSKN